MDLTSNFTSLVKTLRSRSKALGDVDESRSPRTQKQRSRFNSKAKDVVGNITQMKEFFLEHRENYIDQHFIMYAASSMSDVEREQIDSEAHKFIAKCKQVIGNLRNEINVCAKNPQHKEHLQEVILMLEEYLRVVGKIWSSQKALRVRRAFRLKQLSSLNGGQTVREVLGDFPRSIDRDRDEDPIEPSGRMDSSTEKLIPKKGMSFYEDDPTEKFGSVEITQADVQVSPSETLLTRNSDSVDRFRIRDSSVRRSRYSFRKSSLFLCGSSISGFRRREHATLRRVELDG